MDPLVEVARTHEDFPVFLIPAVDAIPAESAMILQTRSRHFIVWRRIGPDRVVRPPASRFDGRTRLRPCTGSERRGRSVEEGRREHPQSGSSTLEGNATRASASCSWSPRPIRRRTVRAAATAPAGGRDSSGTLAPDWTLVASSLHRPGTRHRARKSRRQPDVRAPGRSRADNVQINSERLAGCAIVGRLSGERP